MSHHAGSTTSDCCQAEVTFKQGDPITTPDALVTIHRPDGTVSLVQPYESWWVCMACRSKCEPIR